MKDSFALRLPIANKVFYLILFVTFCLPNNSWFAIAGPLNIREIGFILLPVINIFCSSQFQTKKAPLSIKRLIFSIFILMFITEFIKSVFIDHNISNLIKSFRICLPLLSTLIIVYSGFKADFNKIIKVFFLAIIISILLSILGYVFNLQFLINMKNPFANDLIELTGGRILNDNAAFGMIGLLILFKFKDKNHPNYRVIKIVCFFSILALILSFNRTYLILLLVEVIYLSFVSFSVIKVMKIMSTVLISSIFFYLMYLNFNIIKNQIDQRIIMPYTGKVTINQAVVENNRDIIYHQIANRISEGYWLFGLPFSKPIWVFNDGNSSSSEKSITDISFVNILLRYGIGIVVLYLILLISYYKRLKKIKYIRSLFLVVFPLYLIASLNIDSLMFHNSVFFMFLFSYLYFNKRGDLFFSTTRNRIYRFAA